MSKHQHQRLAGFRDPCALAGMAADTPLAVAFSGGADSVALLSLLRGHPHLLAVHVHHNIRGAEADRDADFCRRTAAELGVSYLQLSVDAPALAKKRGVGLETAARDARYEALTAALRERGIPLLVTAHHADDQLETMLQHLLRGAGTRGLSGIPACRPLGEGILVVRPLLCVPKAALLQYLAAEGLAYVTDSTNREPCCQRNVLRLSVLPLLAELQPDAAVAAARCAEALAEDEAYLDGLAADFLKKEGLTPPVAALKALPAPIFARVLRRWLPTVPTAGHVADVRALLQSEKPNATLALPGARVRCTDGRLYMLPAKEPDYAPYRIPLREGKCVGASGSVAAFVGCEPTKEEAAAYAFVASLSLDPAAIRGTLYLRERQAGDRILSGGMHKAVRRLPTSRPLSPEARARMPLLLDDAGILAVPFGPVRDGMRQKSLQITLCFQ